MMKLELFSDHIATQRFLARVILPISNKVVVLSLMLARAQVILRTCVESCSSRVCWQWWWWLSVML